MQRALAALRRGPLLALAFLAPHAAALELGPIEVRSSLGDPLDARVPLTLASGEYVEGSCFSLLRDPGATLPVLAEGILSVHTAPGGRKSLRIRSKAALAEPAMTLRVRGACAGLPIETVRDYALLVDPPTRQSTAPRQAPVARAASTPRRAEAAPAREPAAARPAAPAKRDASSQPPTAPPPAPAAPARRAGGFVLRLSSADVDLSRSRGIDERTRQRLRERQLVLDADDHVSALLELRHSVRQLETKVAELQLKLTTAPPRIEPPRVEPPKLPPTAPVRIEAPIAPRAEASQPPRTLAEAPKVLRAPPEPPKPAAPEPAKPAATEPAKAAVAEAPKPPAAQAPKPALPQATPAKTAPPPSEPSGWSPREWLGTIPREVLYGLLAAVLLLLAFVVWRVHRARRRLAEEEIAPATSVRAAQELAAEEDRLPAIRDTPAIAPPRAAAARAPARMEAATDAGLSTRLPDNSRELRRRYIEERFPEIATRAVRLDDPSSVIKAARLSYSDGDLGRAVELLHFCIEDNPAEVRFWLALFEIFRLERLDREYARLAEQFKAVHGQSDHWRKVQHFGREIDPGNPLYKEEPVDTLKTIGPNEARRVARKAPIDPIAENWLEAPMDFENEVLANELRRKLMAQAGLTERDLLPNAMPVLRNANMFQVA